MARPRAVAGLSTASLPSAAPAETPPAGREGTCRPGPGLGAEQEQVWSGVRSGARGHPPEHRGDPASPPRADKGAGSGQGRLITPTCRERMMERAGAGRAERRGAEGGPQGGAQGEGRGARPDRRRHGSVAENPPVLSAPQASSDRGEGAGTMRGPRGCAGTRRPADGYCPPAPASFPPQTRARGRVAGYGGTERGWRPKTPNSNGTGVPADEGTSARSPSRPRCFVSSHWDPPL